MARAKDWTPSTTPEVWVIIWSGDWNADAQVYDTEEGAIRSLARFAERMLPNVKDVDTRASIRGYLHAGQWSNAIDLFTDYVGEWGNYVEIVRRTIRRERR